MPKISKYIYVCGPYSASKDKADPAQKAKEIEKNVEIANEIAMNLAKKGYIPFVPHTMMYNWENKCEIKREIISKICNDWLAKCDSLYFIGSSPGADLEKNRARKLDMNIYCEKEKPPAATDSPSTSTEAINAPLIDYQQWTRELNMNIYCEKGTPPAATDGKSVSSEAINALLVEYQQCSESYRHTYQTIWQAAGIFTAISAAIITFAKYPIIGLAPLPVIFWYLGIFIPMDRYGDIRATRLNEIETELNNKIPGLEMSQFTNFVSIRKRFAIKDILSRIYHREWRVKWFVHIFGILTILAQLGFLAYIYQVPMIFPLLNSTIPQSH